MSTHGGHETAMFIRSFSRAQAEKRAAARRAARELASQGGYPAVSMAAVADHIGVARATIYRYFSSKDHLVSEVMDEWAAEINEDLQRNPPKGATLADRVAAAFERVIKSAARHRGLTSAAVQAALSADPAARGMLGPWSSPVALYLKTVVGTNKVRDLEAITMVLDHVLFSALVVMALRGQDPAEAAAQLRTTVRLLLAPQRGSDRTRRS
jgi:AcrR family transcriptional regulator